MAYYIHLVALFPGLYSMVEFLSNHTAASATVLNWLKAD